MSVTIVEDSPTRLAEYACVPIGFTVAEAFDDEAIAALLRGTAASATPVTTPYWKDYDAHAGNHPSEWPSSFDVSRWTILAAYEASQRVGGAVITLHDPQMELGHDCPDCAILWDLRVTPAARRQGIGMSLLRSAERAARRRGARDLRVETQHVNVPACRVYERSGFRLERATAGAYDDLPAEIQLIWRKSL